MTASLALVGLTVAEATARIEAGSGDAPELVEALPPRPPAALPPRADWRIVRVDEGPGGARWVITPPMTLAPREDASCSG
jgi:hypothetical protein